MSVRRYVLALAVLGSCGFPKPPVIEGIGDGDFAMEIASPRIRVVEGSSTTVGVKLVRSGLTAPVTVTVTGLPTGVTADPLTIDADAGTLTLHATADATQGDAALTVAATADGLSHDAALSLLTMGLPGTLDRSFGTGGLVLGNSGSLGESLAIRSDGRIVIAGVITAPTQNYIATRYLPTGELDTGFSNGDGIEILDVTPGLPRMILQPDGKIIVAEIYGSRVTEGRLIRLNEDGSHDNSFGSGGSVRLNLSDPSLGNGNSTALTALAITSDGKILVGAAASFSQSGVATSESVVAQLTPYGSLDLGFGDGGRTPLGTGVTLGAVQQILISSDGSLLTANSNSVSAAGFQRISRGGRRDSTFGSNGVALATYSSDRVSMILQPDGQILALMEDRTGLVLVRLNSFSGRYDTDFGDRGYKRIDSFNRSLSQGILISQPDRKIVVVGRAHSTDTTNANVAAVARLLPNGAFDASFSGGITTVDLTPGMTSAAFRAVALDSEGRIVATGFQANSQNEQLILCRFWP